MREPPDLRLTPCDHSIESRIHTVRATLTLSTSRYQVDQSDRARSKDSPWPPRSGSRPSESWRPKSGFTVFPSAPGSPTGLPLQVLACRKDWARPRFPRTRRRAAPGLLTGTSQRPTGPGSGLSQAFARAHRTAPLPPPCRVPLRLNHLWGLGPHCASTSGRHPLSVDQVG
jgi:hypothetical protein